MAAIRLRNVCKSYRLRHQQGFLARELLRAIVARRTRVEHFHALTDVSFEVAAGDTVGVIGQNGSGKSTLLSLVARTSYPTSGTVEVQGRVGPLLELGAGFHPQLTGLENIVLNASLLGMTRPEVESQVESIVDYAELRQFIDTPVSTYSTGMVARLGFAVLAHMRPDVLLIDEALSVGDARFHQKCEATIAEFLERRTTVMLVSHDLATVRRLCRTVVWLEHGRVRQHGPTAEVCERYLEHAARAGAAP